MKYLGYIAVVLMLVSCNQGRLELASKGASDYAIVIPTKASKKQQENAQMLQAYLKQISGTDLAIENDGQVSSDKKKIFLFEPDGKIREPNQITIRTQGDDLIISGHTDIDTQYAIYQFLEDQLGCDWYAPGEADIPLRSRITIDPVQYSYVPEITTRTVHSKLYYADTIYADQQKVTYEAFPKYVPKARVHTFHRFLPEEIFYGDHPEYFALRGDKRLPTQLCLTNQKVLEIVKDSVAALFQRFPKSSVVSVSQDDNQQHCQCENCSAIDTEEGSPAGTMIRFVNQVAQTFPEKTISTLAYQYTRKPPKTKPLQNVLVTLCSIECDRSASIGEKCTDFADDLRGWGELTENIRIWDYTTQFTNFLAPFPNLHTLKPNIELFRDNNAKWVFEQHSHNPSELFELRSYVTAKLLWNPDLDFDRLVGRFTNGYYKEAAPFVKKYIDSIHVKIKEDSDFFLFLYGDPSEAFDSYLNPDLLARYSQWFNEAETAVAYDTLLVNRVKKARLGVDYAALEAYRKNLSPEFQMMVSTEEGNTEVNPALTQLLDSFLKTCSDNGITLMNEMGFTVGEYGANYVTALETAGRSNRAKGKPVITLTQPKKYANEDPNVLTDGALGGSSFYANWLGYEGNDMEVVVDLGSDMNISEISTSFLQVTNHIVFFPEEVVYSVSSDNQEFTEVRTIRNPKPLSKTSKVNDIQQFEAKFDSISTRYVKVMAKNVKTPYWHHAAGLPSWVFADEIIID